MDFAQASKQFNPTSFLNWIIWIIKTMIKLVKLFPQRYQSQASGSSTEFNSGLQQRIATPSEEQHLGVGRQIRKCSEADFEKLRVDIPYGPIFAAGESQFLKHIKDHSYKHVIDHTPGSETNVRRRYISALRSIGSKARAAYADGILTNLEWNDFVNMLLIDGCLFLQLVLFWFGADLGYPPEHTVFGNERDEKTLRKWIVSILVVGNQLPLVVLETLMSESFFQQAIERTSQWRKPLALWETVLYEFLLAPALGNKHGPIVPTCLQGGIVHKPCDLLHALHLKVLLQRIDPCDENESEVYRILCNTAGTETCRSAKELRQAGIRFVGVDGLGIRRIYCDQNMMGGDLYLPSLVIDDEIELLFKNLKAYEVVQQLGDHDIECYLRFMSQLVPTTEDANILASQGIIKGQMKKLSHLLSVDQPALSGGAEGSFPSSSMSTIK